jgi:hypothetical protein
MPSEATPKANSRPSDELRVVFLALPFDAPMSQRDLIDAAVSEAGGKPVSVGDFEFSKSVHDLIAEVSVVVADISNGNPNVMFELGLAQGKKKPIVMIARDLRGVPFDLAIWGVILYGEDTQDEFFLKLRDSVARALRTPQEFVLAQQKGGGERTSIFVSYSHADRVFLDRLLVHLRPLERGGQIDLWADTRLRAGDRWKSEIEAALSRATVAILLVSADFLASDFITNNELPPLLRNAESKGTRIIPVIVKPCRFTRDPSLMHFQALNDPKGSMILLDVGDQEALYDQLAAEVERSMRAR